MRWGASLGDRALVLLGPTLDDERVHHKGVAITSRHRQRPTVRQVAAAAGVSAATVSNVLNGTGRVGETTRARVLAEAQTLSYLPFTSARAGARGGTGMIGLTLTTYGDAAVDYTQIPYYADLVLAAIGAAMRRGYLLVVMPSSLSSWSWLSTPLDGVIHCEPRLADPVRGILERRQIPMVCVARPVESRRGDYWVDTRVELAVTELLDHLAVAGARRPAVVVPDHDDSYPMIVRQACRDWEAARGVPVQVASFALVPNYPVAEQRAVDELLDQPERPDALVGVYSDSGTHILRAAERLGLAVPDDLTVACISEDPGYAWTDPPVTTASLQPRLLGAEAVDLLLAVIDKRSGVRRWRLVDPILHPRASTAPREGRTARRPWA